jgi:manganese transport protein
VSDKKTMGNFAIKLPVKVLAWIVATILVFLNVKLVAEASLQVFNEAGQPVYKIVIILGWLAFAWLFISMTLLPLIRRKKEKLTAGETEAISVHSMIKPLHITKVEPPQKIAVALDFSANDEKVIAHAIAQQHYNTTYLLLHIVETAPANYLGNASDDYETRKDKERLEQYAAQLNNMNYKTEIHLGYNSRVHEIVRIVNEEKADMLVMGSHRHSGIKDIFYGETVDQVRHKLSIPVLIVN